MGRLTKNQIINSRFYDNPVSEEAHYRRNDGRNPEIMRDQAISNPNIKRSPPDQAVFHQQGAGNERNEKYTDNVGNEWVFHPNQDGTWTLLTPDIDPVNAGSYNFEPRAIDLYLGHVRKDILPWLLWGNDEDDDITYEE